MGAEILWVDLSAGSSLSSVNDLCSRFRVRVVHHLRDMAVDIQRHHPKIICFDFQAPNSTELFALRECKRLFPSIPIVMITEAHSEMLAVWALRTRVWDYLVKPFSLHRLGTVLDELTEMMSRAPEASDRRPRFPHEKDDSSRLRPALGGAQLAVAEAKLYVQAHLADKIVASAVAEHCGLSQFHFSRLFKRETGITFNEYIAKARVSKAMDALQLSGATISHVAALVGFMDLSYFAKVFRRYVNMSPKEYLEMHRAHTITKPGRLHVPDDNRPVLRLIS